MAFYAFRFAPGDRILTGRAEYASNYIALRQVADRTGAEIEVVENDEHGQFDVAALERMLDERVKLVSLVHVPTQSGLVNPAAAVGAITRAAGVPLLLDACQSVGQLHIDVDEIGCDILSATGRKFLRGPRGTGFLYVRRDLIAELEPPFLDMHAAEWLPDGSYRIRDDARRFENWETYSPARSGSASPPTTRSRSGSTRSAARDRRARARAARAARRDRRASRCTTSGETLARTRHVHGRGPERDRGPARRSPAQAINVSVSPADSSQLDLGARGIDEVVRASVHYYNSEDELDRLVAAVQAAA